MDYRIVVDSCVDLSEKLSKLARVPFRVDVDGDELIDRGSTVKDRLDAICFAARSIKTACPSPGDFIEALDGAKKAFVVTISQHLSGSYAAAMVAIDQLRQQHGEACDIHVMDSETASAGESLVALRLQSLLAENQSAQRVAEKLQQYIAGLKTYFVINSMDTLVANGRVRPIEGFALKKLHICPIMGDDGKGRIELKGMARGKARAFSRLIDMIGEGGVDLRERVLAISHVNALEIAQGLKQRIEERYRFKEVLIMEAGGLSSVYASDGGIVIAY